MTHQHSYYLVGIKGVAMTALAQVLLDAGHRVRGSDVAESFVTQPLLDARGIVIDEFQAEVPADIDGVIYTAAHQAGNHPQVQAARARGIPTLSHAEALAEWFNQKQGVAVCGVGGKSTISAMLTWILEKSGKQPSFAVGVGDIIGLNKTGAWVSDSASFVAEADEYVVDPHAGARGEAFIPRFHYLSPHITIASTISFDHPDVYTDEAMTRAVFSTWFSSMKSDGVIISSDENRAWLEAKGLPIQFVWFGLQQTSDWVLEPEVRIEQERSVGVVTHNGARHTISLQIPGLYNMKNAVAALAAAEKLGVTPEEAVEHLATFRSTKRRFEYVGERNGATCYDDYAHHPREIAVVLEAARQWFGERRVVVAFQPHTYSRTKALFTEFVESLGKANELLLLDIFGSARESADDSISSDILVAALKEKKPNQNVQNVHSIEALGEYVRTNLRQGDVLLTLGAGDIYKVHELLEKQGSTQ